MESLHPSFLKDLKCLFDILDTENQGCVSLADIEHYWQVKQAEKDASSAARVLPQDFVESLRKVAHGSGLLSFQRFCSGVKIALCKEQMKDIPVRSRPFSSARRKLNRPRSYIKAVGCESDDEKDEDGNNNDKVTARPIIAEVVPETLMSGSELGSDDLERILIGDLKRSRSSSSTEERKNAKNERFNGKDGVTTDGMGVHESTLYSLGLINGFGIEQGRLFNFANKDSRSQGSMEDQDLLSLQDQSYKISTASSSSSLTSSIISSEDPVQLATLDNIDDEIAVLHEGLNSIQRAREWFLKRIAALQEEKILLERNQQERNNSVSAINTLEGRRKELNVKREDLYCYLTRITDFNDVLDKLTIPPSKAEQRKSLSYRTKMMQAKELSDDLLHKKLKEQKEQLSKLEHDKVELVRELFQTRLKMSKLQDANHRKKTGAPF